MYTVKSLFGCLTNQVSDNNVGCFKTLWNAKTLPNVGCMEGIVR